jgi:hypothetical protein
MKKLLLIILLTVSINVNAAWEHAFSDDGNDEFIDLSSIQHGVFTKKVWIYINFDHYSRYNVGSTVAQEEFNCSNKSHKLLFYAHYSGKNQTGEVLESGNFHEQWEPIIPFSNDNIKYNMVCGK